ncbi:MAG: hypothetical protein QOJ07_239, partial [Thermoleophilaceae bacterium]|nr:hypothetical protein [Thermoleophilaceae bacterium]
MNLRRLAALAACSTALLGAGAAGASTVSPSRVIDCHRVAGPTIVVSSARNMTCKSAAKDINRYRGS